jgi:hypothetical protein
MFQLTGEFYAKKAKGKLQEKKMKSEDTIRIAKREWENIRKSLIEIADIGELDLGALPERGFAKKYNGLYFVSSLNRLEEGFPEHGYFTPEAAYVFVNLAFIAGKKLGLEDNFAESFGSGYSWVRTGFFDLDYVEDHRTVIKQLLFFQTFYPIEGDYNWSFESSEVREKLKRVFNNFLLWQNNPAAYVKGLRVFREKLEPLRRGLSKALGVPMVDGLRSVRSARYSRYKRPDLKSAGGQFIK